MNERVQLTSKFWSIEFSRALLDATQNELLLQNGICFEVAADKRREISNDHNPEVSCTISFILCALGSPNIIMYSAYRYSTPKKQPASSALQPKPKSRKNLRRSHQKYVEII